MFTAINYEKFVRDSFRSAIISDIHFTAKGASVNKGQPRSINMSLLRSEDKTRSTVVCSLPQHYVRMDDPARRIISSYRNQFAGHVLQSQTLLILVI